jgi:uncharacterized NAD(P)/FAD-binding protein YdhS
MKKIVIVGGGFSGTMLALHLCAQNRAVEIHVVEPRESLGLGVAYSTDEPGHLLNVPAAHMSAWPDRPHDFVGYLIDTNLGLAHLPAEYFNTYYAPRMVFGRYIKNIVERPEYSALVHHQAMATRIYRSGSGLKLSLSNKDILEADHIVLAAGLPSSGAMDRIFGWAPAGRYLAHPWDAQATREFLDTIESNDDFIIIGSGLTAVDMLISLEQRGINGKVAIVSRHGLMPQVHAPFDHIAIPITRQSPREWLKLFRTYTNSWRSVFQAMRPMSQAIWQDFSPREKAQFLRHLRPWWDSHRHRVAPEIYRFLSQGFQSSRLNLYAGRLLKAETSSKGFVVSFQGRRENFSLNAQRVINCTGPESQLINFKGSLFMGLLKDGLITPDSTGLGINSNDNFQVIPQNGYEGSALYVLGALRRGTHWEATAVPELRVEAGRLAHKLSC